MTSIPVQPASEAEYDVLFGTGISRVGELIDLGVEQGVVDKSGAWYAFGSERLGQGKENVRAFLQDNDDLRMQIERALLEHLGMPVPDDAPAVAAMESDE